VKKENIDMVKGLIDRLNGWSKILVVIIPILIGGLIGYGKLQGSVSDLEKNKANNERVGILETTVARNTKILDKYERYFEQNNIDHIAILRGITKIETQLGIREK
jgi:hypothetical protein